MKIVSHKTLIVYYFVWINEKENTKAKQIFLNSDFFLYVFQKSMLTKAAFMTVKQ